MLHQRQLWDNGRVAAITLTLQLLALVYVFVLPGWLVASQVGHHWQPMVRLAVGLMVGLLTVPLASFCAAWLLGTNVRPVLVIGVATVANLGGAGVWWLRRRFARAGVQSTGEP